MSKIKKHLEAAREFIAKVSGKRGALFTRESELKERIDTLNAERRAVLSAYEPGKPFDAGSLQRIDDELKTVETELLALSHAKQAAPEHDALQAESMLDGIRAEAAEVLAVKAEEAEAARQEIERAKAQYLDAIRKYGALEREARHIQADYNEMVAKLSVSVKKRADVLRDEAHAIDLRIMREGGDHTELYAQKSAKLREATALGAKISDVPCPVRSIDSYALSGVGNPLIVSGQEISKAKGGN